MESILLIEDDKDILENIIEYLELEGYKVYFSNNGKKGVELAKEFLPDLIICDVLMREMDGYDVLRVLLNSNITYEIPFIFSTSMSEKVSRSEALSLGADDYIIKPFELENLLNIAKTWIKSGSTRNTHHQSFYDTVKQPENIQIFFPLV
jgi:CheY-like chemotaxis protein